MEGGGREEGLRRLKEEGSFERRRKRFRKGLFVWEEERRGR